METTLLKEPGQTIDFSGSVSGYKWVVRDKDPQTVQTIKSNHDLPLILSEILAGRGVHLPTIESFLNPSIKTLLPDPSSFMDMDKAAERIAQAVVNQEKIFIFGDYDVDGATSSSLLKRFFRMAGLNTEIYIPDRVQEGYGPTVEAFTNLKEQGANIIITVDCGTAAVEPITKAKELGVDVIVIDHHIGIDINPPAYAIVNPNRLDETCEQRSIAAVGVSFIFAVAINRVLRQKDWFVGKKEPDLLSLLDLVALGTVCDVIPLTGINRAFVSQGLKILAKRGNIGLAALADSAGVKEQVGVYHLGFILGPRINAGGRVGKSDLGARLLSTEDLIEAASLARDLEKLNAERKALESQMLEEAKQQAQEQKDNPIIIVKSDNWHQGVIGIICSRLKDEFKRPIITITIANGIGKASARSITSVDIGSAIAEAKMHGLLLTGGGHAMAAGFTIEEPKVAEFSDFIINKLGEQTEKKMQGQELFIDSILNVSGVNNELSACIQKIGPFGAGNHEPVFVLTNVTVQKSSIVGQNHVKCLLSDNNGFKGKTIQSIAFKKAGTELGDILLNSNKKIHVAGQIRQSEWNGNKKTDFIIEDLILA